MLFHILTEVVVYDLIPSQISDSAVVWQTYTSSDVECAAICLQHLTCVGFEVGDGFHYDQKLCILTSGIQSRPANGAKQLLYLNAP